MNATVPVVLLSHRKREFLETAVESIRRNIPQAGGLTIVDDSGDHEHREWLADHGYDIVASDDRGRNVGYLTAMHTVWEVARRACDEAGSDYALLWEEDFTATRGVDLGVLAGIMDQHRGLAQLNLQRQAVYKIERYQGYMESHVRRGYGLSRMDEGNGVLWVARKRPFTTNPSLIRRDVLDIDWPSRAEADAVQGGAEPAMSLRLEKAGYHFGWYGEWNTPYTHHLGTVRKSGIGY